MANLLAGDVSTTFPFPAVPPLTMVSQSTTALSSTKPWTMLLTSSPAWVVTLLSTNVILKTRFARYPLAPLTTTYSSSNGMASPMQTNASLSASLLLLYSSIFLLKHSTGYSIIATLKKLYTILMTFFLFRPTILPSFLPYAHSSALKSKQANPSMVALWTSSVWNLILIKWKLVSLRTNTIARSKQFYQPSLLESPLTRILRVW